MSEASAFTLFQELAWAEQQTYGSPLEKLMMLRIVGSRSNEVGEYGSLRVDYAPYAAYCCCSPMECADALTELNRRGVLQILAGGPTGADVALGIWPGTVHGSREDLRPLGDPRSIYTEIQKGCCWYCGGNIASGASHFEHQVPLSRGGPDTLTNLVLSCPPCNHSKGTKTVTEFRAYVIERDRLAKSYRFWGEART